MNWVGLLLLGITAGVVVVTMGLGTMVWVTSRTIMARRRPDDPADPAEWGLDYETVSFTSRDGLRLGGWFVPSKGTGRGTVILCHGHGGSLDSDLRYVPWLHHHGYHVLQFDFRAHGRSEGQIVSMGYKEYLDLLGAVDYLRQRGTDKVGVIGFSMGGAVALRTAAICPHIAAVVSDGGFGRLLPTLEAGMRMRGVPAFLAGKLVGGASRLMNQRLRGDVSEADPVQWIAGISPRPVLLIHGGQDAYVSSSEIQRLYDRAREPKVLWLVEEAGHRRVDQACPQEYEQRVVSFLDCWLALEEDDA